LLRAFKPAVCQAQDFVLKDVQDCRLPGVKRLKPLKPRQRSAAASTRHSGHSPLLLRAFKPVVCQAPPSVLKGVQTCHLPGVKRLKPLQRSEAASTRHSGHSPLLLRAFKPAVCQTPTTVHGNFDQALRSQPSVVKGLQTCRLPGSPLSS